MATLDIGSRFGSILSVARVRTRGASLTLKLLLKNPTGAAGFVIMAAYVSVALILQFAPWLLGITHPGIMVPDYSNAYPTPPSQLHPLGTTYPGIDVLSAIIKAIRVDVFASLLVVGSGAAIGTTVGILAGFHGRYVDQLVMRVTDVFFSLPFLVLAIAVGFTLGRAFVDVLITLIIVWWPIYARLARGQTLAIKNELYVKYSLLSGNGSLKTIYKHIFPNTLTPILIQMSVDLANVILLISGLYFIGFVAEAPYLPELGSLISYGYPFALSAPWTIIYPGIALLVFALGMNLLGDGLRDALNPRSRI